MRRCFETGQRCYRPGRIGYLGRNSDGRHTSKKGATVSDLDQSRDHARAHDPVYDELHAAAEFTQLRRAFRSFVFPTTVAFLAWYLLYVVMSMWAHDFMSKEVWGNVNVALVFGLLQFVTTFLLAWVYSRYSTNRLDPLARRLDEQYIAELEGRR